MTDDVAGIVKRLRERSDSRNMAHPDFLCGEAADLTERLSAQVAIYKKELEAANNSCGSQTADWPGLAGRIEEYKADGRKAWAQVAERDAAIARLKMENSKLRSALEIVHFKREPWK